MDKGRDELMGEKSRCVECLNKRLEAQKNINKELLHGLKQAADRIHILLLVSVLVSGFIALSFTAMLAIRGLNKTEYNVTSDSGNSTLSEGLKLQ